ncbi:MAG: hypothetical protein QNJ63_07375 [Calothrix sp. MO_192.B10]|nr:hypothetical protein [Calothrix sp. MO_192.B10]
MITAKLGGDTTKVINLIKSIEKTAEENPNDSFLVAMVERAKNIQERFENRQTNTQEALDLLAQEITRNEQRKKEQSASFINNYHLYRTTF